MGFEKHTAVIDGRSIMVRTLDELDRAGLQVTVLGQEPLEGRAFIRDGTIGAGPAAALIAFRPETSYVFVVSCDIPYFSAAVIEELKSKIGAHDAAIPMREGRPQFLCALYTKSAFEKWGIAPQSSAISMHELIAEINALEVHLETDVVHITGVNTPGELEDLSRRFTL